MMENGTGNDDDTEWKAVSFSDGPIKRGILKYKIPNEIVITNKKEEPPKNVGDIYSFRVRDEGRLIYFQAEVSQITDDAVHFSVIKGSEVADKDAGSIDYDARLIRLQSQSQADFSELDFENFKKWEIENAIEYKGYLISRGVIESDAVNGLSFSAVGETYLINKTGVWTDDGRGISSFFTPANTGKTFDQKIENDAVLVENLVEKIAGPQIMMSEFEKWKLDNSQEYKGYLIGPSDIKKDGKRIAIFFRPISASNDEAFEIGRRIIDAWVDADANANAVKAESLNVWKFASEDVTQVDYKKLLEKYMRHVFQCEGSLFVDRINEKAQSVVIFSEQEVAEIRSIAESVIADPWKES